MFGLFKPKDLTPQEVLQGLRADEILLVDVREHDEHAAERIQGAHHIPLSSFDPRRLPDPYGRAVVFHCASGKRSTLASLKCRAAGVAFDGHLAGGILAWKRAGLPTVAG